MQVLQRNLIDKQEYSYICLPEFNPDRVIKIEKGERDKRDDLLDRVITLLNSDPKVRMSDILGAHKAIMEATSD